MSKPETKPIQNQKHRKSLPNHTKWGILTEKCQLPHQLAKLHYVNLNLLARPQHRKFHLPTTSQGQPILQLLSRIKCQMLQLLAAPNIRMIRCSTIRSLCKMFSEASLLLSQKKVTPQMSLHLPSQANHKASIRSPTLTKRVACVAAARSSYENVLLRGSMKNST